VSSKIFKLDVLLESGDRSFVYSIAAIGGGPTLRNMPMPASEPIADLRQRLEQLNQLENDRALAKKRDVPH